MLQVERLETNPKPSGQVPIIFASTLNPKFSELLQPFKAGAFHSDTCGETHSFPDLCLSWIDHPDRHLQTVSSWKTEIMQRQFKTRLFTGMVVELLLRGSASWALRTIHSTALNYASRLMKQSWRPQSPEP